MGWCSAAGQFWILLWKPRHDWPLAFWTPFPDWPVFAGRFATSFSANSKFYKKNFVENTASFYTICKFSQWLVFAVAFRPVEHQRNALSLPLQIFAFEWLLNWWFGRFHLALKQGRKLIQVFYSEKCCDLALRVVSNLLVVFLGLLKRNNCLVQLITKRWGLSD